MTHTTTDAAEARAARYNPTEAEKLADSLLQSIAFKVYTSDDDVIRKAATMLRRLATAEAASGAGEREAIAAIIDPAAMKSMDDHTAEWQTWVDEQRAAGVLPGLSRMAPDSLVRELASKDYEAQANARTRALAKADAIRALASLSSATDPAMVRALDQHSTALLNISEHARELRAALTKAHDLLMVIEQTNSNLWWVNADDPEVAVCDTLGAIEAALAAAPTIPAMGEAKNDLA